MMHKSDMQEKYLNSGSNIITCMKLPQTDSMCTMKMLNRKPASSTFSVFSHNHKATKHIPYGKLGSCNPKNKNLNR